MARGSLGGANVSMTEILNKFYPVGTIYETTSSALDTIAKMATQFGGTWEVFGAGQVLVALNSADTNFDTLLETGGAKTHTLDTTQIPAHKHSLTGYYGSANGLNSVSLNNASGTGGTASYEPVQNTGGGLAHNNLQPYIVVYRYRRLT